MESYGVCLDAAMDGGLPPEFVAALAAQLPQDCRWRISYERDAWWTGDRILMASLQNALTGLIWGMADPKRRGPRPQLVGPKWLVDPRTRTVPALVFSKEKLLEQLSRPRREG